MATGEGNQGRRRRRRRRSHSMFSLILNASPLHPSSPLLQRGEQQAAADRFKNQISAGCWATSSLFSFRLPDSFSGQKSGRLRLLSTGCECRKEFFFQCLLLFSFIYAHQFPFHYWLFKNMLMADFRPLQFDILQNDQKKLQKFVDLSWNGELRIVLANY